MRLRAIIHDWQDAVANKLTQDASAAVDLSQTFLMVGMEAAGECLFVVLKSQQNVDRLICFQRAQVVEKSSIMVAGLSANQAGLFMER